MSPLPALTTGSSSLKAADLQPLIAALETRLVNLEVMAKASDLRIAAIDARLAELEARHQPRARRTLLGGLA